MLTQQIKKILDQQQQTYTPRDIRKITAIHIAQLMMIDYDRTLESAISKYFARKAIAN